MNKIQLTIFLTILSLLTPSIAFSISGISGDQILDNTIDLTTKVYNVSTTNVPEGTNQYYTNSRFNTSLGTKTTDDLTQGSTNKYYATSLFNTDLATKTTDNLTEGSTNKYFSQTLARNSVSATTPLNYNSSSGIFSIALADSLTNGYLSSTDWNTFNDKQSLITAGTTAQYYRGDKTFQTLDTLAVPENTNFYHTNARTIASLLTGYSAAAGTVTSSDSILTGFNKLAGNQALKANLTGDNFTGAITITQDSGVPITETLYSASGTAAASILGRRAGGTQAIPAGIGADIPITGFFGAGMTSSLAFGVNAAAYRILSAESFTTSAQGTYLAMSTSAIGTTTRNDKLFLDSDGSLTVGTVRGNATGTAGTLYAGAIQGTSLKSGYSGTSGAKTVLFQNANLGTLTWNPTATRTVTIPDATGTVVLDTDTQLAQATEANRGTAEIATDAEMTTGTSDVVVSTPLKLMNYKTERVLSTTTGIDAKSATTTTLYTVPSGKTAIITGAVIRPTTTTAVTVSPTLGIGIAAGESDVFSSVALTGLDTITEVYKFTASGLYVTAASTNVLKLGIDVGASATTMTVSVDLIGYLI